MKWRARYRIVHIQCDGHYLHIKNQTTGKTWSCNVMDVVYKTPVKLLNIDTQFCITGNFINYPVNFPTITLHDTQEKFIYALTASLPVPPSLSLFLIGMLTRAKQDKPQLEFILSQPVLKAHLTWHSWISTVYISLGNLNKQLCMFNPQKALAHELLMKL